MSGTFIIRPTHVDSQSGSGFYIVGTLDYVEAIHVNNDGLLMGLNSILPVSGEIRYNFVGDSIYLDGSSVPISFQTLPAGFTPITATLISPNSDFTGILLGNTIGSSLALKVYFQFNSQNKKLIADFFTQDITETAGPYSFVANPVPSMLSLINNGCGINWELTGTPGANHSGLAFFDDLHIFGTYNILRSQFSLSNPTVPISVGDKIEITSPTNSASDIKQILFDYIDPVTNTDKQIILNLNSNNITENTSENVVINGNIISGTNFIIFQSAKFFQFYLPFGFGTFSGTVTITLVVKGTQFSGSVVIGTLQILFEDTTGIYTLVKGQTNDLLYFREGHTTDIKFLMLSEEEFYEDSFFNLLSYPYQILVEDENNSDDEDLFTIPILRPVIFTSSVEIPSPFIRTAFLP